MTTNGRKLSTWWQTLDFRPAPAGWRVAWIWDNDHYEVTPVAGWLLQERYYFDEDDEYVDADVPRMGRPRRAIPAIVSEGSGFTAEAIDENVGDSRSVWRVLSPDEPEPDLPQRKAEIARRAGIRAGKR
jgi:hypothetical protein